MSEKRSIFPNSRHFLIIVLLSLVLMIPALLWGAGGKDLHIQSLWTRHFSAQFWQGEFYPRWLSDMFAGEGSPVFFYYPPLAYFATALFSRLAAFDPFGYYPLVACALLAVIASGVTCYIWIREETQDSKAALLGSLLYVAAPSHVAVDFYQLLLYSSCLAYIWPPLMMLFTKRLMEGKRYSVAGLAISLGLLVMTNLPMTVMFGPVTVAYGALRLYENRRGGGELRGPILRFATAISLGFGLAGIYLLPALLYQGFANVDLHWRDLGTDNVWSGSESFFGFDTASHTLNTLYFGVTAIWTALYGFDVRRKAHGVFFVILSLAALFMMLPVSGWAWSILPAFKVLQFPERFFAIPALCSAMLAALCLPRWREVTQAAVLACIVATFMIAHATRITPASYRAANPLAYEHYLLGIEQYATYLTSSDLIKRYGWEGLASLKEHPEKLALVSGDASAQVTQWLPRVIRFHYKAQAPSVLRIRQYDYPGFRAFKGTEELEVTREKGTGEMLLSLPPAEGDVELRLTKLLPEIAGASLSMFCAAFLLFWLLVEMKRSQETVRTGQLS